MVADVKKKMQESVKKCKKVYKIVKNSKKRVKKHIKM